MAARIPLGKNLAVGSPAQKSIHVTLADPPFIFQAPGTWTGTILIEHSMDEFPEVAQSTSVDPAAGVPDASATWSTLVTLTPGAFLEWKDPMYRIRANPSGIASGSTSVFMLEGIRSLKNQRSHGTRSQRQTRNG